MYVQLGAATQAQIDAAQAAMPSCMSYEWQGCEADRLKPAAQRTSTWPGCKAITDLYDADEDAYHAILEKTPYCPAPSAVSHVIMAGAGGLVVGLLLALALHP
jgi:hypothetical protein